MLRLSALVAVLALVPNCFAFIGMQSKMPAASSPLFSMPARLTRQKPVVFSSNPDKDQDTTPSTSDNNEKESEGKTLGQTIDDFGMSLKPKALKLMEKKKDVTDRKKRVLITAQICVLFMLFLGYRAYRGFFILLPAVFREVYRKLETAVDSPFVEEPGTQDINPETGKIRWRTRITVSVLAAMVTMSYVVGGMVNVLVKFVKTVTNSSSASSSFQAAAKEAEVYEEKIRKMTSSTLNEGINGTKPGESGLAP